MSGGLTPCRQLRPSSRREHVSASNSHVMGGGKDMTAHPIFLIHVIIYEYMLSFFLGI